MQDKPEISYSQRFEDFHLFRCFGDQPRGFYIDIGAGHPVFDNVSFKFYLRGWRGLTVEPNPWLAQLSQAVRPHDQQIPALIGAKSGYATFFLVEDFHGMSTTIEAHALAVESEFGKKARKMLLPVTTLASLCENHAHAAIDFLKIDVEGAEYDVLVGGDWRKYRPKVVVLEAFAPVTLAPTWPACEGFLADNQYRFAFFDTLNRYYVANECGGLADRLAAEPPSFDQVKKFRDYKPALDDASHPDHRLATLLPGIDMIRLPLLEPDAIAARLTAGFTDADLDRPATAADIAQIHERLFGGKPSPAWIAGLKLSRDAPIREVYRRIILSDRFRAACGRISASYAW